MTASVGAPLQTVVSDRSSAPTFERIQILRFFAALAVIVFHANGTAPSYLPGKNVDWLVRGYLGVDIFFVISGFIICHIARTREANWKVFLARRFERIVPLYWLITLVTFFLITFTQVARSGPMPSDLLIRSLAFVQWTAVPSASPVVFVGRSLEFEMFFYIVFAIALIAARRPAEIVAAGLSSAVTIKNLLPPDIARSTVGFFVNPIFLEFVLGIIIAQAFHDRRVSPWLLAIVAIALVTTWPQASGTRVWIGGIPGAVLVAAALWLDLHYPLRHRIWRGLVELGGASYSLYLFQALAISASGRFLSKYWPTIGTGWAIVALSVAAVLAGYLGHLVIERPLGALVRRITRFSTRPKAIPSTGLTPP